MPAVAITLTVPPPMSAMYSQRPSGLGRRPWGEAPTATVPVAATRRASTFVTALRSLLVKYAVFPSDVTTT